MGYGLIADGAKGPGVGVCKASDAAITLQKQDMCQQIGRYRQPIRSCFADTAGTKKRYLLLLRCETSRDCIDVKYQVTVGIMSD